jgi:hypothetical protein
MSVRAYERSWADVLEDHAARDCSTARLVSQLAACEAAALAFCRLLDRWARGEPEPATPGRSQAALGRAADRAETALAGLEGPLGRYLLELEPDQAEGRSWYGAPGAAELLEWEPILKRAGVQASPIRVAQAYLELAVFVRALQGLSDAARIRTAPDRSSLWAGLFDLRENLLGRTLDDLRALAVT